MDNTVCCARVSWGGYFRILPPSSPGAVLNLGICAGCGQNVPGKGYYVGTGFSITFNNYAEGYSSITVKALPAGDTADIEGMQVYLSFIAPPGLNPGSFKTFTDYGPPVTPSSPLTAFPSTFFANAKDNVTYKDGSTTYTVPYNSVNPDEGLFLALHFDVVQYCSS
ncbi:hypothetical protein CHLRE_03g150750v5 [Chlamydomonas reinhardtii]|uniref:Uncharacterized protein n=1 Tax=Chlamydomonas reinhardtii TaxID=3055 RepID=A0A2K3DVP7_CHLRE|nr:uncharacterized protein CHLRE_03g150750v5 [Chlamydomonas reinhardtii]PNW84599.1 hypothetical protein CHLRE_03g150750v5 [Chlamydomonas reinhardtii]